MWGIRYIDELVCRDDATPERLYACQDANFNLTAITDTSGSVQQRFVYDPYGASIVTTGSWTATTDAYAWTCRFTGRECDPETQICLYRARYYQPMLGRFTSRDPLIHPFDTADRWLLTSVLSGIVTPSYPTLSVNFHLPDVDPSGVGDGVDLYQYCLSNPTTVLDPSGAVCACVSGPPTPPAAAPAIWKVLILYIAYTTSTGTCAGTGVVGPLLPVVGLPPCPCVPIPCTCRDYYQARPPAKWVYLKSICDCIP